MPIGTSLLPGRSFVHCRLFVTATVVAVTGFVGDVLQLSARSCRAAFGRDDVRKGRQTSQPTSQSKKQQLGTQR